ncbi:MAG: GNAT family N-acetyltransferase [Candidatus Aenigmatarchaeota archaeon]
MKIRKAMKNDLSEIWQQAQTVLWNEVWFSKRFLYDTFEKFGENSYVFEDENKKIGGAAIFQSHYDGRVWTWMIYIRNDLQKKGFGTDFLKSLEKELRQKGYRKLYVDVTVDDAPSILFHIKNGFKISGVFPEWHGKRKDALILHKNL